MQTKTVIDDQLMKAAMQACDCKKVGLKEGLAKFAPPQLTPMHFHPALPE